MLLRLGGRPLYCSRLVHLMHYFSQTNVDGVLETEGGRHTALYPNVANWIINTSYQKLPFGSGDYPDKLLFHQALN